jgi:hypothetical protein
MKSVMKKINVVILLTICCLAAAPAFSQEGQNVTRFGVKGGVNFSNFRVDGIKDNNIKAGLNLGLFLKLPIAEAVAIQPEILYSSKGSKLEYDNFAQGEGEYRFNMNYLEMPVMGVFAIGDVFNVQVGPYIAYLTSSNIKNMNENFDIQGVKDLDEDSFNRFDYGLAAGVGFDFQGFVVGARYSYGLNEVGKSNNLSGQLTNNSKNSAATIYLGFGF